MPRRKEVILTDFSAATPAKALSSTPDGRKWRVFSWQTQDLSGKMLFAGPACGQIIRIPLNVQGWHAVAIGLYTRRIRLRLTGDRDWHDCWMREGTPGLTFQEQFWRLTDLTGRALEINPGEFPLPHETTFTPDKAGACAPAFIRMIPLTGNQVAKLAAQDPIPWLGTNDGHGVFAPRLSPPSRAVTDRFDGFRGTNWRDVSWCILGADLVNYQTRIGTTFGARRAAMHSPVQRAIADNLWRVFARGQDPAALAVRRGHRYGMRVWIGHRLQAYAMPAPNDAIFNSRFCLENPQWACRTRAGARTAQMSFAFPQVRRRLLDITAEVLSRAPGAAGMHLLFNRGLPCTYFEAPVVRDFRKLHRADIRKLPPLDPRVTAFRARYVTLYLEELAALLKARGGGLRIIANVLHDKALNDEFGFDVEHWAGSGLVARLLPFRWEHRRDVPLDIKFWRRLRRVTQCEIWPYAFNNNFNRGDLPQTHRARVLGIRRAGFDGLAAWDPRPYVTALGLDRRNELEVWSEVSRPLPPQKIHRQDGIVMDECPPIHGF